MERIPTLLTVVAGLLSDGQGRILMQERPAGKAHGGLWEFPGGKVEPGENPRSALVRELNEELGIDVDPAQLRPVGFADGLDASGSRAIVILLYRIFSWVGDPRAEDGAQLGWFEPSGIESLPVPPLDADLIERLEIARG